MTNYRNPSGVGRSWKPMWVVRAWSGRGLQRGLQVLLGSCILCCSRLGALILFDAGPTIVRVGEAFWPRFVVRTGRCISVVCYMFTVRVRLVRGQKVWGEVVEV